jgi:homoserine/homoserine lactone efflux protein
MTFSDLGIYLLLVNAAVYSPGPMTLFCMANGVNYRYPYTLFSIFGGTSAYIIQISLVTFGLSLLINDAPIVLLVIKYSGILYLFWLGVKQLNKKYHFETENRSINKSSFLEMYKRGFIVGISNPKAILFFSVFLPQFVNLKSDKFLQLSILGIIFLFFQFISAVVYTSFGYTAYVFLKKRNLHNLQPKIFGGILIGIAITLLFIK